MNLSNGSGAVLLSNLCQIISAIAPGFLFVIIFHRSGSLLPCILIHSTLNALSAWNNEASIPLPVQVFIPAAFTVIAITYAWFLLKTLPQTQHH